MAILNVPASKFIADMSNGSPMAKSMAAHVKMLTEKDLSKRILIEVDTDDDFLINGKADRYFTKEFPITSEGLEKSLKDAVKSIDFTAVRGKEKSLAFFFQDMNQYVNAKALKREGVIQFGGNQIFRVTLVQPETSVKALGLQIDLLK